MQPVADVCVGPLCGPPQAWLIGGSAGGAAVVAVGLAWAWLGWLRWLPVMGGFTRLRTDRLLDHPVRARLHSLVEAEPGIHHQALIDGAALGKGQAAHHLSILVRAGILATVRRKGFALYFVKGAVDAPVMHGLAAVKSRTAVRALRSIAHQPGQAKRSLARELECSESTLRHHLRRLADAGLVEDEDGLRILPLGEQVMDVVPEAFARPKRPPGAVVEV